MLLRLGGIFSVKTHRIALELIGYILLMTMLIGWSTSYCALVIE